MIAYALGSHAGAADADVSNRSHASGGAVGMGVSEDLAYSLRSGRVQSVATPMVFGGNDTSGERSVAAALTAHGSGRYDFESENFVVRTAQTGANGHGISSIAHTLDGASGQAVLSVALRGRDGGAAIELGGEQANALRASQGGSDKAMGLTPAGVRRLTPMECERLQGFPDNWTAGQSDSTRYRQLGNAVAVSVARWLGRQIVKVASGLPVPVGPHLAIAEHYVGPGGYVSRWRIDTAPGGVARWGTIEGVRAWWERSEQ